MKPQAVFNKVVRHARKQGCRSYDKKTGSCTYRGPEGTRCFVGALIPNRLYRVGLEGWAAGNLVADFPDVGEYLDIDGEDAAHFLTRLQSIHDDKDPKEWEDEFSYFADEYGLTVPEEK